ncbi:MAG: hypothetical protein EPO68_04500 [Planctomycetota bacterium]|nr:MAG: hypothetical protein EPO68_04500 [Planctomycetota bacterium]
MRPLLLAAGLLVGLVALPLFHDGAPSVRASTVVRMDTAALVDGAELIVDARVRSARAIEQPGRRILTELTLDVGRTWLGEPLQERVVRLPGGVLDDGSGLLLAGVPIPGPGERCVLFLSAAGADGLRLPVGLAQGCARVHVDAQGHAFAYTDTSSLALVDPRTGVASEGARGAPLSYERLAREIERGVKARAAKAAAKGASSKGAEVR